MSEKTIYDCERAKFEGFGTYKLPIEERVNEIMEATKKEYPTVDNYLLWLCAVDYVLEEKGLKKDNEDGVKMYEDYVKERKIFIYNTVKVEDDDVIKYDYNVLQEVQKNILIIIISSYYYYNMNRNIKYKQVCKLAIFGNDDINNKFMATT